MNTIKIVRSKGLSNSAATYGKAWFNNIYLGVCVEQPWNNNLQGHSCIPDGTYELHAHESPKHPNSVSFHNPSLNIYAEPYLIPKGINGRSDCLIHSANFANQLEGCVALGLDYMKGSDGKPMGVTSSKVTIDKLTTLWADRKNLQAVVSWSD